MTLLFVVVAIALVAAAAVLVVRDQPIVEDDPVEARRLSWPPAGEVGPTQLSAARFTVALRGYRMDEVDRVLADAATALAERDARIAALEAGSPPRGSAQTAHRESPEPGPGSGDWGAEPAPESPGSGPEPDRRADPGPDAPRAAATADRELT